MLLDSPELLEKRELPASLVFQVELGSAVLLVQQELLVQVAPLEQQDLQVQLAPQEQQDGLVLLVLLVRRVQLELLEELGQ